MSTEFKLIRDYFMRRQQRDDVILGIGDDAAVLQVPAGYQLVQSVDTLVEGVHFPVETSAQDIAFKVLAVNLSDMAAMGATPAWFTLALTLPGAEDFWLKAFSESLFEIADHYDVELVGGDTSQGPLSITISMNGFVEQGRALQRGGAAPGDRVYVSGQIGDAALALAAWQELFLLRDDTREQLYQKLNRPVPRVELGQFLRNYATACIDISDGLIADLQHLTEASDVAAVIDCEKIPLSNAFRENMANDDLMLPLILSGGDDYELCFTIAEDKQAVFEQAAREQGFTLSCIGEIKEGSGVQCFKQGKEIRVPEAGYQHFMQE